MIALAIQVVVFIVCMVIIVLIVQWALAKLGVPIDPTLKTILGLLAFLILLIFFLNIAGYMSGIAWIHR